MPSLSVPRFPNSVAAVPEASHRAARGPLLPPDPYFSAHPTAVPAVLMAEAAPYVTPPLSVPRFPNSVAAVPQASQRTARGPLSPPNTHFSAYPTAVPAVLTASAKLVV